MKRLPHEIPPSLPGDGRRAVSVPQHPRLPHPTVRHVVLFAAGRVSLLACRPVAWGVLGCLLRDPGTLAACLLADRLEWLHRHPRELAPLVADVRATGEAAARHLGLETPLWAGDPEVLMPHAPDPGSAARDMLAAPGREGWVAPGEAWVLSFRRP